MRQVPLAWLQLTRDKKRFSAALAGIAFAVVLMLMQLGLRAVLFRSATKVHDHLVADLIMTSAQYEYLYSTKTFSERRLYSTLVLDSVQSVAPVYVEMGTWRNPATLRERKIFVIAFDPSLEVVDIPGLEQHLSDIRMSDVVLFDAASRPELGPVAEMLHREGTVETELNERRVKVTGLFEIGPTFGASGHLITGDLNFLRLFHRPAGAIDLGLIRLKRGADPIVARARLAAMLPNDVVVLTREAFVKQEMDYWADRVAIGFIFNLGSLMGLLVGAVIVYQILYTDVTDHLNEYATLKAIGYLDRQLFSVVIQESLILSLFGFAPGYAIAQALYLVARLEAQVPLEMTLGRSVSVLLLTMAMCVVSGGFAMRKLKYADPAEVF